MSPTTNLLSEADQRAAVVAVALSWKGTPFHHEGTIKGRRGGVDCGQSIRLIFEEAIGLERKPVEQYSAQWHMHRSEEKYVGEVLARGAVEIPEGLVQPGDIVVYKCGRSFSHGGIVVEPWPGLIIHAVNGHGVIYSHGTTDGFVKGRERRYFTRWPHVSSEQ